MSIDPSIQVDGWEAVSESLEELRAGCEGAGQFLASRFDELESLVTGFVREREEWLSERARANAELKHLTMRLEHLEEEHTLTLAERESLQKEHVLLEGELDHVRRRAAQLAEHLEDERRMGGEQASHWRDEFRRLRSVLEDLTARVDMGTPSMAAAARSQPDPRTTRSPESAGREHDHALESVQAQFELLQKDASRRREDGVVG
ncbi:MAG: hypothetical protein GX621_07975 [Pirellulaceae bacterium]|nr:hypothetical protein [Pirellulaceae bacterium]